MHGDQEDWRKPCGLSGFHGKRLGDGSALHDVRSLPGFDRLWRSERGAEIEAAQDHAMLSRAVATDLPPSCHGISPKLNKSKGHMSALYNSQYHYGRYVNM